jgi:hypothetical protein
MLAAHDLRQAMAIAAAALSRATGALVGLAVCASLACAEPAAVPWRRSDASGALLGEAESYFREHEANSFLQRFGPGRAVPISPPTDNPPPEKGAAVPVPGPGAVRTGRVEVKAVPAGPALPSAAGPVLAPLDDPAMRVVTKRAPAGPATTLPLPLPLPSAKAPAAGDLAEVRGARPSVPVLVPRRAPPGLVVAREVELPAAPEPATANSGLGAAVASPPVATIPDHATVREHPPPPTAKSSSAASADVGYAPRQAPAAASPPAAHSLSRSECRDVIARAQIGAASAEEIAALRTDCH